MKISCVLAVLVLGVAMSRAYVTPSECIILWTGELFRRIKEIVYYVPVYFHGWTPVVTHTGGPYRPGGIQPGIFVPAGRPTPARPGGIPGTTNSGTKPTTTRPEGIPPGIFVPGGRPTPARPGGIPGTVKPEIKPTTKKPTTSKPGGIPSNAGPQATRPVIPPVRPALPADAPPETKPTATTTTTTTTTTTSTTESPQIDIETETTPPMRTFYNMSCGECPPGLVCLCPGVNFH